VLTSATLAVSPPPDRFAWLRRGTGVGEARGLVLDSPFDYRRQSRLVIDPLPEPTDPVAWTAALIDRIPVHVRRSDGRAFVLFTSRKTMEAVADGVRAAFGDAGIELLVQGRGVPRSRLLQQFRERQPAALFGLSSFWEGVGVPGHDLAHVILTRLPFAVPDHPLEKARAERLERAGGDAFTALAAEGGAALQAGVRPTDPDARRPRRRHRPRRAHRPATLRARLPARAARLPQDRAARRRGDRSRRGGGGMRRAARVSA
jgi:Rad3-related DNA helicase